MSALIFEGRVYDIPEIGEDIAVPAGLGCPHLFSAEGGRGGVYHVDFNIPNDGEPEIRIKIWRDICCKYVLSGRKIIRRFNDVGGY